MPHKDESNLSGAKASISRQNGQPHDEQLIQIMRVMLLFLIQFRFRREQSVIYFRSCLLNSQRGRGWKALCLNARQQIRILILGASSTFGSPLAAAHGVWINKGASACRTA
jgi:hypothetical protein